MAWPMGNAYGRSPITLLARLESKILPEPNSGCWLFTGGGTRYGLIWVDGKQCLAHRVMWELVKGPIPEGRAICHHCDVGFCINPDHLFVGTQQENIQDSIRKGRHFSTTEAFRLFTQQRCSHRDLSTGRLRAACVSS